LLKVTGLWFALCLSTAAAVIACVPAEADERRPKKQKRDRQREKEVRKEKLDKKKRQERKESGSSQEEEEEDAEQRGSRKRGGCVSGRFSLLLVRCPVGRLLMLLAMGARRVKHKVTRRAELAGTATFAGAGEPRQRRAATQEDATRRAADRMAMREELSRLWEGLLDAQQGDCMVSRCCSRTAKTCFSHQHLMCFW
jgi:hypothetical protein